MTLAPHILAGALIGSQVSSSATAFALGVLGHYFLDLFPHYDYPIYYLKRVNSKFNEKFLSQMLKVFLDLAAGVVIVFWILGTPSLNSPITWAMLGSIIPDGLTFLYWRMPKQKILKVLALIHETVHLQKEKPGPNWFGLVFQTSVTIITIALLFSLN
ncbi:MAG: hypothetical protein HY764_03290 [Candidatus Portnoybacteria bacterium]|nr:hypothetical protein [Candidatus Portnoybacteria bacterium]